MTTRHNLNINPAAKNNITNWAQSGAATPAQATGLSGATSARTTGAKWTTGTYQTTAFGAATPGTTYTVSMDVLTASFNQTSKTLYMNWSRSSGGDLQQTTATVSLTAGTWSRVSVTGVAPALATGVGLLLDGINASVSNMTITGVLAEAAGSAGTYFDGDSASSSWDGTAGNSASTFDDTPTGPTVKLWNGTSEVDVAVTLWDGASEVAVSLASITT